VHARLILLVLLAIELALLCEMCDLHFKFEEDETLTLQVILYLSSAMNCIGQTIIE